MNNTTDNVKNSYDDASKFSNTKDDNNINLDFNNSEDEKQISSYCKEIINEEFQNEQQEVVKHFLDSAREMNFKNGKVSNFSCFFLIVYNKK